MNKLIDLINSYGFSLIKIIIYEFFHITLGYKGNSINFRNSNLSTDNIPCPYFFLVKINNTLKKKNIESFVDLGCGSGRAIDFFNKKNNILLTGIEFYFNSFILCKIRFKKYKNITIINQNFFLYNFKKKKYDCYFLNDPLKKVKEHNKLIYKIISNQNNKKLFYIVLVNVSENKLKILKKYQMVDSYTIKKRGFYIYKINNY